MSNRSPSKLFTESIYQISHCITITSTMAPGLVLPVSEDIKDAVQPKKDTLGLPEAARKRLEKAGIDLSNGYPYRPAKPLYLDDVIKIRDYDREHVDPGSRADPEKKALFSAAKEVIDLTAHIGTEIVGLQLKDLTDKQKDELGLLIAERSVVFFRDQDISPQQQKALGEWYGEIEVHVWVQISIQMSIADEKIATSSFSTWRTWNDSHLACATSDRIPCKLQTNRRCVQMAY